jgi:hypothetical protein
MKINEKKIFFILLIILISGSLYYNINFINKNNNKYLLLCIVILLFIFYTKFINGRIEKFYSSITDLPEDTEIKSGQNELKKLYLNKSQYHNSSIAGVHKLNVLEEPKTSSELHKTNFKFYDESINPIDYIEDDNNVNVDKSRTFLSKDYSFNDIFKFNYKNVDNLLDNVSSRNYNFDVVSVDFNSPISTNSNSVETGSPSAITDETGSPSEITDETGSPSEITDETGSPSEITDETGSPSEITDDPLEPIIRVNEESVIDITPVKDNSKYNSIKYIRRRKNNLKTETEETEKTEEPEKTEETEKTETGDVKEKEESETIYNRLFSNVKTSEKKEGLDYYVNVFFTSLEDLFN